MNESAFAVEAAAGPALRLAERIAAFDARAVTPRAKAAARMAIIDTVGALMSGACTPFAQWVVQTPGVIAASGLCVVAGTARRTTALDAALANAAAACAAQRGIRFAVLFALAEEHKLSGERFFSAWLAGEAAASGLQNAAPLISTVAAASHLLRLDTAATALAVSVASASGFEAEARDHADTTPLFAGQQARAALLAVMLAAHGDQAALPVPRHDPGGMLDAAAAAFGSAQENVEADSCHDNCDAFTARCAAAIGASEALALYERLEAIDEVSDVALLGKLMAKRALPGASSTAPLALSTTPGDGSDETAWVP